MNRRVRIALQIVHALVAVTFVCGVIVEFSRSLPFFDSYFDTGSDAPVPRHVFHAINPVIQGESAKVRQLMDIPILFITLVYFGSVLYLRFKFLAFALTVVAGINMLTYFIVNAFATSYFEWRYFYSRGVGIVLQVFCLALLGTVSVVAIMWRRKRMRFHMESPFNITVGSPVHVVWNIVGTFTLYFLVLLMWISRSYQSYVCTEYEGDIAFLCQMTEQVACIPCSQCSLKAFDACAANANSSGYVTAYCLSGIPYPKGFCIFNYSTGYFTFVKLFASIGGLFFFLRNFLNASMHYILLLAHSTIRWWRGKAAVRLEATWSSLSARFSVSANTGNLRSYFQSRSRQHSAPGLLTPPGSPVYRPPPHSPILEASTEESDEPGGHESSSLLGSARRSGYSATGQLTVSTSASDSKSYTLPLPAVQPEGVGPGSSMETSELV